MTASGCYYPSGLAGPTDTQDRGRKPSLSSPKLDPPTTQSNFALSGSGTGVPGSGVGIPAVAAAAGEGPSPTAQQLHSLQPHATVRDLTHVGLRRISKRRENVPDVLFYIAEFGADFHFALPIWGRISSICSGLVVKVVSALLLGNWQDFN